MANPSIPLCWRGGDFRRQLPNGSPPLFSVVETGETLVVVQEPLGGNLILWWPRHPNDAPVGLHECAQTCPA